MIGTIIFNLIIAPLEYLFELVFSVAYRFFDNPIIILVALSIVVNLFALPLYKRADAIQEEENAKQAKMAPWVNHIKKTFKGDERYMMLTAYYRTQNYKTLHSLRGSFSILLQIPFFIAAYHFLSNLSVLKTMSFWVFTNLGEPDALLHIGSFNINVLPIIMTLINVGSAYIYLKGATTSQKIQTYFLAAAFLVLLYKSPSGLVIYWTCNQIFSLLKNVFMKLVKNDKVLGICVSVIGIVVFLAVLLSGHANSKKKLLFIILILICCQIPLVSALLKNKKGKKAEKPFRAVPARVFFLTSLTVTILLGVIIPLSVISSSPAEFVSEINTPLSIVVNNVSIMAGIFIVWCGIFYYLGKPKTKTVYAYIMFAILGVSVADFFFFSKGLGTMSDSLVYDNAFSFSLKQKLFNLAIVILAIVICLLIMKFFKRFMTYIALVLLVASIGLTITNTTATAKVLETIEVEDDGKIAPEDAEPLFNLSTKGKNVIILMMDRAISSYVPEMFRERTELKEQFSGFVYYPNTMSFGPVTNIAIPALFGGYEYTPSAMNSRPNETLKDKHNEALTLMPKLFGSSGYEVTVLDPAYANYDNNSDLSLYDGLENVKAMKTISKYKCIGTENIHKATAKIQNRNFFYYSFMKAVPLFLQNTVYDKGNYYSLSDNLYTSEVFTDNYAVLELLSTLTNITDEDKNTVLMMDNETTHSYTTLTSDYAPGAIYKGSIVDYFKSYDFNGYKIGIDTETRVMSYQVNMAAFLKLGEWFDYLKENGVWDNTRIIIAADHGYVFGDMMTDDGLDIERFNPTLMVKDFNSDGEFKTSDEFMTNADVPTIAMSGLIDSPINPATGKPVNSAAKNSELLVTTSSRWHIIEDHVPGYVFNTTGGQWWEMSGSSIFDSSSWHFVAVGN